MSMWKVSSVHQFILEIEQILESHDNTTPTFDHAHSITIKVSGSPCNDHNLRPIDKKNIFQPFFYFSVQIGTENYKLIYDSQFRLFFMCGKIFKIWGIVVMVLQLLPQMYTAFKEITPMMFWVRDQTLYAYRESCNW